MTPEKQIEVDPRVADIIHRLGVYGALEQVLNYIQRARQLEQGPGGNAVLCRGWEMAADDLQACMAQVTISLQYTDE